MRCADRGPDEAVGAVAAEHVVGEDGFVHVRCARSVTSTRTGPAPSWVTSVTSALPRTVTDGCRVRLARRSASSSGWSNMFASG